jgi:hypothetical protein
MMVMSSFRLNSMLYTTYNNEIGEFPYLVIFMGTWRCTGPAVEEGHSTMFSGRMVHYTVHNNKIGKFTYKIIFVARRPWFTTFPVRRK